MGGNMTNIYLIEVYLYGEGVEMPEYHEFWAETIEKAREDLYKNYPKAYILNEYIELRGQEWSMQPLL